MSICQVPILEGLHFLSHIVDVYHANYSSHSYHIHSDNHTHDGLDMIKSSSDDQEDSYVLANVSDIEKKPQISAYEAPIIEQETFTHFKAYFNFHFTSQVVEIQTPPPQA